MQLVRWRLPCTRGLSALVRGPAVPRHPLGAGGQGVRAPQPQRRSNVQDAARTPPSSLDVVPGRVARAFSAVDEVVVFSDLHCTASSAQVCAEILDHVHGTAVQRNAGLLFLGDFWHDKGLLPVEALNVMSRTLQSWTQPAIFLTGNHDQFSADGKVHSLEALCAANAVIHVVDTPSAMGDALFLPYRPSEEIVSFVRGIHGEGSPDAEAVAGLRAVFAHLDTVGGRINESFQAKSGVEPALWRDLPVTVWSGHYHKPHRVDSGGACDGINYVGSCRQVSRSEAGQAKRMVVLDHHSAWRLVEELPLDYGPRYFSVSVEADAPVDTWTAADWQRYIPEGTRQDDRVTVSLTAAAVPPGLQECADALRDSGRRVEVLAVAPAPSERARIQGAEMLGIWDTFEAFLPFTNCSEAAADLASDMVRRAEAEAGGMAGSAGGGAQQARCELHGLTLAGWGPFSRQVHLDLRGRGVTGIIGAHSEGRGDSNGAGKSMLVSSLFWALTGVHRMTELGSTKKLPYSALVSDNSKAAEVTVSGTVNGRPFELTRRCTRKALQSLRFSLDGRDVSSADAPATQATVDATLRPSLLLACTFFNQGSSNWLLQATDKEFKQALGSLINVEVWEALDAQVRQDTRKAIEEKARADGALQQQRTLLKELQGNVGAADKELAAWERKESARLARLRARQAELGKASEAGDQKRLLLRDTASSLVANLRQLLQQWKDKRTRLLAPSEPSLGSESTSLDDLTRTEADAEARQAKTQGTLARHESRLSANKATATEISTRLQRLSSMPSTEQQRCEACGTMVKPAALIPNLQRRLATLEASMASDKESTAALRRERDGVAAELASVKRRVVAWGERRQQGQRQVARVQRAGEELATMQERLDDISSVLGSHPPGAEADAPGAGSGAVAAPEPSPELDKSTFLRLADGLAADVGQLQSEVVRLRSPTASPPDPSSLDRRENPFTAKRDGVVAMVAAAEERLGEQQQLCDTLDGEVQVRAELGRMFSRRGVQNFVVEGALLELQRHSQSYLDVLSDGAFELTLAAVRAGKATGSSAGAVEGIDKTVTMRLPDGRRTVRQVEQLSSGERRRVALAMSLGYAGLVAQRGALSSNLLVLDEVLQHLDPDGCRAVFACLRGLPQESVLVCGQPNSVAARLVDRLLVVTKSAETSSVREQAM